MSLAGRAAVSRTAFDAALVREAIAGAAFLPANASLQGRRRKDLNRSDPPPGALGHSRSPHCWRRPVSADGGRREAVWEVGSRIGAGVVVDDAPGYGPHTIHMACGRAGYVGLVR